MLHINMIDGLIHMRVQPKFQIIDNLLSNLQKEKYLKLEWEPQET